MPLPPESNREARMPRLDAVRALAIFSVFAFHVLDSTYGAGELGWRNGWRDWHAAPDWLYLACYPLTFGWLGVALFFVLSGFVIHHSFLASQNSFTIRRFYWRRFWRIYPPYLLALLVFTALTARHAPHSIKLDFTLHLALLHNLVASTFFGQANASFWSIGTEVQFYLVYPLMLGLRRAVGMANVAKISLAIAAPGLLLAVLLRDNAPQAVTYLSALPTVTWFGWVLGALIAEGFCQGRRWIAKPRPWLLGLGILAAASTFQRQASVLSFTLAMMFCAVALECWVWSSKPLGAVEKMALPLGLCSYSFYLWHQPLLKSTVFHLQAVGFHPPALLMFGAMTFFPIYALSWLLYVFVEKRCNAYGRTFLAKKPFTAKPGAAFPDAQLAPLAGRE